MEAGELPRRNAAYLQAETIVEWLPGYIDYREIREAINAFKVLTVIYKKFVHSNNQVRPEVQAIDADILVIVRELGEAMWQLFRLEVRKSDAFLQYKSFELHASWRYLEECWANLKRTDVRSHDYSEKRRCLKSAMVICYRNVHYVRSFRRLN